MKKIILLSVSILGLISVLRADVGCDKSSDACEPRIKKTTPFMAELRKAQAAPALRQGRANEQSLKQGGPEIQPAAIIAATAAAAPAAPLNGGQSVSSPIWLLAGFGLLAGLYYFLSEGKKRRKNL